jgi:signal transduction histidine kinase
MSTDSLSADFSPLPGNIKRTEAAPVLPVPLGQVYLNLRQRRLQLLNETARQLRAEGVPFTARDLKSAELFALDGKPITPEKLPLLLAWQEGRPLETQLQLHRPGKPAVSIFWSVVPHREGKKIVGVFGSVGFTPPTTDWAAMAGLAHDLRTPLNALGLLLSVLDRQSLSEDELREMLGDVRATVDRSLRVGMDLLEWCRASASRGREFESSWFALEPFLDRLVREQVPAAKRKSLHLASDLGAVRGWQISTDRVRLGRLLSNLLVNAVRYTRSGSVTFSAEWRGEAGVRRLSLGVIDTGAGIAPDEHESIFQPFERGQAGREDDSSGSGLGLMVVDQLAEELHLELEVYSEYGRGSAFRLLVPQDVLRPAPTSPADTVR